MLNYQRVSGIHPFTRWPDTVYVAHHKLLLNACEIQKKIQPRRSKRSCGSGPTPAHPRWTNFLRGAIFDFQGARKWIWEIHAPARMKSSSASHLVQDISIHFLRFFVDDPIGLKCHQWSPRKSSPFFLVVWRLIPFRQSWVVKRTLF